MDERQWIERNAAQLGRALADPAVRVALLAPLGSSERDRLRRLEAARAELVGQEVGWRLVEEDEHEP